MIGFDSEETFQNHLDKHPEDHFCRMVFADWLEERDDPRAEGYRALGKWERVPLYDPCPPWDVGLHWKFDWNTDSVWWDCILSGKSPMYPFYKQSVNCLPQMWIKGVVRAATRRELENKVAYMFFKLSDKDKLEFLNPELVGV